MDENKSITPPPFVPPFVPSKPKCVNHGRPVWLSFVGEDNQNNVLPECVGKIVQLFEKYHIEYCIDNTAESSPDISTFDKKIGWASSVIVLVFSDSYFRSFHCMYEFVQIKNAIKKHPGKRLFCVKGDDNNLSDINYILDLERFWGARKQDYEEVSYHHTRPLTGVERAANENGFYMSDIRSLYSFFSSLNYVNSKNADWDVFVKEIALSYSFTSKYQVAARRQHSSKLTKRLMLFGGIMASIIFISILFFFCCWLAADGVDEEYHESYSYNYFYEKYTDNNSENWNRLLYNPKLFDSTWCANHLTDCDGLFLVGADPESLGLYFGLINTHDTDTIVYASRGSYVEDGNTKNKYYLSSTASQGVELYPAYWNVKPHDTINFFLNFGDIPLYADSLNFWFKPGKGILGVKFVVKREE